MRALDHLVLPAASLDMASSRLSALGFTVAPRGLHPFGTENACIYFADETFLEPLAIADASLARSEAEEGNVFTARDLAYRSAHGENGLSALVVGTSDADADHERFCRDGFSAGAPLVFSRPAALPDGTKDEATFKLAFAAEKDSPDCFFFACERVKLPKINRSVLETHPNGVMGIKEVVLCAPKPGEASILLESVTEGIALVAGESGRVIRLANTDLSVISSTDLTRRFDVTTKGVDHLTLEAIVFTATNLEIVAACFASAGITYDRRGATLHVGPAGGQGAAFAFEELQ